jgi:hypothetical protein
MEQNAAPLEDALKELQIPSTLTASKQGGFVVVQNQPEAKARIWL